MFFVANSAAQRAQKNIVISGPIDLNFSAMLPETFTFQRATVDSTATTEEAAIYISTPVRRRLQFT